MRVRQLSPLGAGRPGNAPHVNVGTLGARKNILPRAALTHDLVHRVAQATRDRQLIAQLVGALAEEPGVAIVVPRQRVLDEARNQAAWRAEAIDRGALIGGDVRAADRRVRPAGSVGDRRQRALELAVGAALLVIRTQYVVQRAIGRATLDLELFRGGILRDVGVVGIGIQTNPGERQTAIGRVRVVRRDRQVIRSDIERLALGKFLVARDVLERDGIADIPGRVVLDTPLIDLEKRVGVRHVDIPISVATRLGTLYRGAVQRRQEGRGGAGSGLPGAADVDAGRAVGGSGDTGGNAVGLRVAVTRDGQALEVRASARPGR